MTALAWRQYRLERRMFWRNPSAAFFNFLLPLLFLGLFGAIFAGSQNDLDVIVPGIAGMSVMTTTFVALAMNMVHLREQGVLKRLRGTPLPSGAYLGGLAAHSVTNTAIQLSIVIAAGALVFGVGLPENTAPKSARNSSGRTKLKNAALGLRQNIRRSRRYWRQVRASAVIPAAPRARR